MPNGDAPSDNAVRRIGADGTAGDALFTIPDPQTHIERKSRAFTTYSITIYSIPYARSPIIRQGPEGHLHCARNDSPGVRNA